METPFTRLRRMLQNAIPARFSRATRVDNVRVLPVTGRARVPLGNMPRVREVDGPTIRLPRPGQPGVNSGGGYTPRPGVVRHRAPDGNNQVPSSFTRQRVA